jgi:nucleoside-diphosphate-sugar epimerase
LNASASTAASEAPGRPLCAVTGAGGYLGSCVKAWFEQHGWAVLALTRRPEPGTRAAAFRLGADVNAQALKGVKALVHCAYDFQPRTWAEIRAVNVAGSDALFRAAHAAGVEQVVCISSLSAYAGCRSLYGRAKLEIERAALAGGALVLRPGLIHGEQPRAMFGRLVRQVEKASVLPLFGGGRQVQHLVHQADLCAFIHRYAGGEVKTVSQPLAAAHERGWMFREILEQIARVKHRRLKFVPLPWRPVWAAMKAAEFCGVPLEFRSDSLESLMQPIPPPDFAPNAALGLICRPFQVDGLNL